MDTINKLIEYFREFPGVGPRQAKRFVYFLLARNSAILEEIARLILELKKEIKTCSSCFRFFPKDLSKSPLCDVCRDGSRDRSSLMVVAKDVDFEIIEKSRSYSGYYFILGGTVPILEKNPEMRVRADKLLQRTEEKASEGLKEIIVAMNLNPEGENTGYYIQNLLKPVAEKLNLKVSVLGRGLSTGTELEYSDAETIKNALKNRD